MADSSFSRRQPPHPQPQPQPQPYAYWLHHPPPPPLPLQPHYRCTSPFLRSFSAGMTLLLLIAIFIYTVEYLIFGPLFPNFRVDSLQLANFSASAPSLSTIWVVGFSVGNPNKKLVISLDNIESSIYYEDKIFSQARIHRFAVPRRNSTAVVTPFVGDSAADVSVLNEMKGNLARGAINFTVGVLGHVAFQTAAWRWRGSLFGVFCSDLAVGISSTPSSPGCRSSELVGGSRQCQVR